METRRAFVERMNGQLAAIDPEGMPYNEDEFWLIRGPYEYLERYAVDNRMENMYIALPLVRCLHNGVYRKFTVKKGGVNYRMPYVIHCLQVCRFLADIHTGLPHMQEDRLLAAALCHDLIEDVHFNNGGLELTTDFRLDPQVYEIVQLLSKRPDFSPEEEQAYFDGIRSNPLALLVKLADRGNNVEDLYNMSPKKFAEYLEETETYFFPMIDAGLHWYPDIAMTIHILREKITILSTVSRSMVASMEERIRSLRAQREVLREENDFLRDCWRKLREEEMSDGSSN